MTKHEPDADEANAIEDQRSGADAKVARAIAAEEHAREALAIAQSKGYDLFSQVPCDHCGEKPIVTVGVGRANQLALCHGCAYEAARAIERYLNRKAR